jgi:hypothetical protein
MKAQHRSFEIGRTRTSRRNEGGGGGANGRYKDERKEMRGRRIKGKTTSFAAFDVTISPLWTTTPRILSANVNCSHHSLRAVLV